MKVEAKPKRMFIARLNLKGFVGVIRHRAGMGKKPKFTFDSFVDNVDIASSSMGASLTSESTAPVVLGARRSNCSRILGFSLISKDG